MVHPDLPVLTVVLHKGKIVEFPRGFLADSCPVDYRTLFKKILMRLKKKSFPYPCLERTIVCLAWQEKSPIKFGPFLSPPRKKALVFIFCKYVVYIKCTRALGLNRVLIPLPLWMLLLSLLLFFYYFRE